MTFIAMSMAHWGTMPTADRAPGAAAATKTRAAKVTPAADTARTTAGTRTRKTTAKQTRGTGTTRVAAPAARRAPAPPPAAWPPPRADHLIIPAGTLLGWSDAPGDAGTWGLPDSGDTRNTLTPIARGTCDHRNSEDRYTPSRKLKHLVRARTARCPALGCGAQSYFCDQDHTVPYPAGPADECNLSPPCRRHHRCKQAPGWKLEQPEPGLMKWRTPSGRVYTTRPTVYDT
jgi:hypothetical protein